MTDWEDNEENALFQVLRDAGIVDAPKLWLVEEPMRGAIETAGEAIRGATEARLEAAIEKEEEYQDEMRRDYNERIENLNSEITELKLQLEKYEKGDAA